MFGSKGTSEKVVLFFFRTEYSKRKFVFHFFKAIFGNSFRPSRSFFGKWSWFAQMVNAIPGRNLRVLNFAYHLPKPKTDRLANVNVVGDSDLQIRGGGWGGGLGGHKYIHTYTPTCFLFGVRPWDKRGPGLEFLIAKPVSRAFEFPSSDIFDQNQVTFNLILGPTMYKHKPAGEIFNIRSELNNEFRW